MKDGNLRPAYNLQIGTQNSFVTGFSISQNANDAVTFKEHMESRRILELPEVENIMADSVYGTLENYDYLDKAGKGSYLKYPMFYKEISHRLPPFSRENFLLDETTGNYLCPQGRVLIYRGKCSQETKSGYKYEVEIYECEDCSNCAYFEQCCRSRNNRRIEVNKLLNHHKKEVKKRLLSDKGKELRRRRGFEVETPFGDMKHNMGYRRMRLRGLEKVKAEMALILISYNLRKVERAG
jgi:hypothetical protein